MCNPSKVFCKILLSRIDIAIDDILRPEQAGFRKGKGCVDQIFTLRNIIEQSLEWNSALYVNFIDFKKAFDSVHRDSLWRIISSYGIPPKIVQLISIFYNNFECSIINGNTLTDWFKVESGVRQGCILSPILFLITIDWVMKNTTADKPRGIQWTLFSKLEDLDFADDLALLSSSHNHIQEKTNRLCRFAQQTGLTINEKKTQIMKINNTIQNTVTIKDHHIEEVDDFTYLGSLLSKEDSTSKDIKSRLNKARTAFAKLRPIWKSQQYSLRTKLKLYNSNVKSVLLYGSECWRETQADMNKLSSFHNGCLRKICKIFWPEIISNADLFKKTNSLDIVIEIRRRRMRWLGHVLRMPQESIPKVALRWTPQGKRNRGRPKTTWRRTVLADLEKENLTWGEAEKKAKNRTEWRSFVAALCPRGDEEDK